MEIAEAFITIKIDNARLKRELTLSQRAFEKAADRMKKSADKMQKAIRDASVAVVGVGVALTATFGLLAKEFIGAAATMERLKFGLIAVAGSAEEANKQFQSLREVAKLPGLTFQQAVQGSINLQAAGLNAKLAERSLKAFGNALVTVGRSAADLRGVNLALTQILTKTSAFGQEIRQLSERLPQVRVAMKNAFGVASAEEITKLGLTSAEFVERLITEFEKLPRVTGGAANAIDNLRDAWMQMANSLGQVLLPAFTSIVNKLADVTKFLEGLTDTQKSLLAWTTVAVAGFGAVATAIGGLGLLLPVITAGTAGLGVVFASLATVGLGPIGIGIAAIAIAVTGLAIAYKEFGKSRKEVRLDQDLKALEGNISGIESQIALLNKAIGEIETAVRKKGVKSISLLGTSLKNTAGDVPVLGKALLPVGEQIERIRKRIARLIIELDFLRKTPKGIPGPEAEKAPKGLTEEEKVILRVVDTLKIKANLEKKAREEQARRVKIAREDAFLASRGQGAPFGFQIGIDREMEAKKRLADFNEMIDKEQGKRQVGMLAKFREFAEARRKELKRLLQLATKASKEMDKRRDELAAKDKAMFKNLAEGEITTQADVDEAIRKGRAEGDKLRIQRNLKTFRTLAALERSRIASFKRIWDEFTLGIQQSFTDMFGDMLTKGRADWSSFAADLKSIFLRNLAEIAVSAAFKGLFDLVNRLDRVVLRPVSGPDFGTPPPGVAELEALFGTPAAPGGVRLAPGGNIIVQIPNADIEHMSSARAERLIQRTFGPAQRRFEKRGIIARRM